MSTQPVSTPAAARANCPIRLSDAEIAPFLAATAGVVAVDVSASWCMPCRLLGPVMRKLAAEFAGRMVVLEVDGDTAETFTRAHAVDSYPHLLFFKDGALVEREIGFTGADAVRASVMKVLGDAADGDPSDAELTFRDAYARARARFDDVTDAAGKEVEPHMQAIAPALDALQASLEADQAAGRIAEAEVYQRLRAEYDRLCAPFEDKLAAMGKAQTEALAAYEDAMNAAVDEFTRKIATGAGSSARASICQPGDPFCTVARSL
jgi:thioredoxin 1